MQRTGAQSRQQHLASALLWRAQLPPLACQLGPLGVGRNTRVAGGDGPRWRPCLARLHERRELCERDGHGEASRRRAVEPAEHLLRDVAQLGAHPALRRVRWHAALAEAVVVAPLGEPAPRRPPNVLGGRLSTAGNDARQNGPARERAEGANPLGPLDMLACSSPQAEGCPSSRYSRTLAHARKPAVQSQPEGIQHASTICGANRARAVAWPSRWTSA